MPVPDKRWVHLCESFKPRSRVQAVLEIWDIAGLVKGAHEGQGLGNEFLANIQAVDAIYHVVRAFRAKHIEHVEGSLDPIRDIKIIANELRQKDISLLNKKYESLSKLVNRSKDKRIKDEFECVKILLDILKDGKDLAFCGIHFQSKHLDFIRSYNLFTCKPIVFLVNVSESNWLKGQNKYIADIQQFVKKEYPGCAVIPFSAAFEKKISEMSPDECEQYLTKNKTKSVVNKIIHQGMYNI